MSDARDILYFSLTPWDSIRQRPQHLASGLAETHRIVYVDPLGPSWASLVYYRMRKQPIRVPNVGLQHLSQNLWRFTPPLNWLHFHHESEHISRVNHALMRRELREALGAIGFEPDIVWLNYPLYVQLLGHFGERLAVYDCLDDFAQFPKRRRVRGPLVRRMERQVAERVDMILASSQRLYDKFASRHERVHIVRNAAEAAHFMQPVLHIPADMQAIKGPIAGYAGMISNWFDFTLIEKLLNAIPDLSVVCIGPQEVDVSRFRTHDRLHFLGQRAYADLPGYFAKCDVLLIPFVVNELIQAVNPVKVYEYLATGKPVVTTDMAELAPLCDVCYVSPDHTAFVNNVQRALAHDTMEKAEQRRAVALRNQWHNRTAQIERLIQSFAARFRPSLPTA